MHFSQINRVRFIGHFTKLQNLKSLYTPLYVIKSSTNQEAAFFPQVYGKDMQFARKNLNEKGAESHFLNKVNIFRKILIKGSLFWCMLTPINCKLIAQIARFYCKNSMILFFIKYNSYYAISTFHKFFKFIENKILIFANYIQFFFKFV